MSEPVPYYQDEAVTLYRGDALLLIPELATRFSAVVTDPPYSSGGAFRSDRTKSTTAKYVQSGTVAPRLEFSGDNRDQRAYMAWCTLWLTACYHQSCDGAVACIFTDWRQLPTTTDAVQAAGFVWRGVAVWDKGEGCRPQLGAPRSQAEYVVWGTRGPSRPERNPVVLPGVIREPVPRGVDRVHVAQKPEAVMRWLVAMCEPGGVVLDPFAGSGTTLLAAKMTGRRAVGFEVDERHCFRAAERLRQMSITNPQAVAASEADTADLFELEGGA